MRKSVIQIFSGNLVSKVLGLGREVLLAALFGTGQAVGAFRVAQMGTGVPVHFFTSDSLNSAFIPQYRRFQLASRDKSQTLFWALFVLFGLLGLSIAAGIWAMARGWAGVLAPGLEADTVVLAASMLKVAALGVPFYMLSALLMFLSMANADMVPMATRAAVQNIGMISAVVASFLLHNALYLAWGFTGSYVAFGLWVFLRSWKAGFLDFPVSWEWQLAREVLQGFWRTLRPLLALPIMMQGNVVIERAVASLISLAAISALDYARFVTETSILLISVPVAFAGLTHWSGLDADVIRQRLRKILLLMLMVSIPLSAFLAAHARIIVEAIYARGAFDSLSVRVTSAILFGVALGLWAQVVGYVLIKALNAQMRNRSAVFIIAAALIANVAINLTMHTHFGAMTLGIGNSAYGLVLFCGTLTALGLWKEALKSGRFMILGAALYLLLDHWLPAPGGVWTSLATVGGFAAAYWAMWIVLVPSLRLTMIGALAPNWRTSA